jgi:hypothetical protein
MIPVVSFDPNGFLRSENRAEKHLIQSRGRFVLNFDDIFNVDVVDVYVGFRLDTLW